MKRWIALVGVWTSGALAQAPVVAPAPTGSLSGVIRDLNGAPLPDVTVSLLGESNATRSDSAGRFALRNVPVGSHTALFRRIGYRSIEYRWNARNGLELQVSVAMTVVPRSLERVIVEAPASSRRRGTSSIAGTVVDSAENVIEGADVRLLGSGLSTTTDSAGRFAFRMLAAGSYIVRVRRLGHASGNSVMQIVDDDDRGITLKLYGLPSRTKARDSASASGYGFPDAGFDTFDRRERNGPSFPVLGPGDLFRSNRSPLDFVLQHYRQPLLASRRTSIVEQGSGSSDEGDCLLLDGKRAVFRPLRSFSAVDVQLIEVFRANALVDEYIVSQMELLKECRGTMDRHPSYFVLWTRAMR
jgi:hypothetical protein